MSERNGLLTVPEDEELLRIPGFCPDGVPSREKGGVRLARRVLHEWPLSRVELAEFPDLPDSPRPPARRIVKTQLSAASAEGEFYRYAAPLFRESRSRIRIPEPLAFERAGDCDWLILSFEDGKPEDWSGLTEDGIRGRVREIAAELALPDLSGAPVFTDWSTPERFAADLREDLPALRDGGCEGPGRIPEWAERDGAACWEAPVGLLHGDLKADNLINGRGCTILLDWQRPVRGPLPLEEELSVLLERGIPEDGSVRPRRGSPGDFLFPALACFYLAHWYAWAFRTCLPYPFVLNQAVQYASAGLTMIHTNQ